jgi:hypothetical protein
MMIKPPLVGTKEVAKPLMPVYETAFLGKAIDVNRKGRGCV